MKFKLPLLFLIIVFLFGCIDNKKHARSCGVSPSLYQLEDAKELRSIFLNELNMISAIDTLGGGEGGNQSFFIYAILDSSYNHNNTSSIGKIALKNWKSTHQIYNKILPYFGGNRFSV
ncbi:MAG: hypothetical protein U5K00_18495 [Melioribacteraceae bacterium]|nr:hypothetical protein [Melioribacteraceae bacterium]